ncbi:glycoside hydrolase family 73 protein [Lactobacillus sp. ESL0684]|uniref:glycoside hydrolase family 73 protein n=1 Tax=Lactobacillus sp. ESL0684 TaxID=2983213 RepID=UPI0023F68575|nr:glycoside hydrolase family 73 protein [Lactobacillus sp. ESL0684]WEV43203.1 glycoside hydrolase family 73 protein [Lactobacillus sp. ESL0684]
MAKKRKRKKQSSWRIIITTFIILFLLIVVLAGARYYRNQAIESEQIRQEQLARKEAREKVIKQHKQFIKQIGPIAKKVDQSYDLLPSITIAQACLESDYGQSSLSQKYNNLFGVKGTNPNTSAVLTTKEYVKGKWVEVKARFQIYDSYEASIRAHAELFQKGTTWNHRQYRHVLAAKDYEKQAHALVQDGYATDPNYADKLIKLIKQYNLEQYDN